jgi:hypothetical protein
MFLPNNPSSFRDLFPLCSRRRFQTSGLRQGLERALFDGPKYLIIEASAQPLDCTIQTPDGPRKDQACAPLRRFTREIRRARPVLAPALFRENFKAGIQTEPMSRKFMTVQRQPPLVNYGSNEVTMLGDVTGR